MIDGLPASGRGDLFIAGRLVEPTTGRYGEVRDPSDGSLIGPVALGGPEDVRAAVDAAASQEERWGTTPGHERARRLREIARRIRDDGTTLSRLIAREVGKPIVEARIEAERAAQVFEFAAEEIRQLGGESFPADAYAMPPGNEHRVLFTVRDPIGVVAAIGPFNFPLNLLSHKIAPALAAGDPVVAKPTSAAPFTALRLAELAHLAGLPDGVLNIVLGPGGAVGDPLVTHPKVRLVTFTGSTAVGTAIAAKAAAGAKRVILEMGGLDPLVVLADADLELAVTAALRGSFGYSGQVCTASKRLLVADAVAPQFGAELAKRASALRIGPALEESTQMGPVIDAASVERIEVLVEEARSRSARLLTGGVRGGGPSGGHYYRPTVLDEVPADARIATEEPFGPVVPILRFHDEAEAVRIANGTDYGLQASIFTRDLSGAMRLARRLRAGGVHINDPTTLRWDALPFGGTRWSGIGREGLRRAMEEMTEEKLISINYAPSGGTGP
jgi:acyl-CoA reductase-like NAD-dependent aldehyde dehydrogenase